MNMKISMKNESISIADSVECFFKDNKFIFEGLAPFSFEEETFSSKKELMDYLEKRDFSNPNLWEGDLDFFFK